MAVTRPLDLGEQVIPFRKPAADLALRQLDQQRPDRRAQRLEILERDQPVTVADQLRFEAVQVGVTGVLVELEVAGRVKRDRACRAPIAVNPQRDLLRHRPARQQHRSRGREQRGDPALESLDVLAFAVVVRPDIVRERRCGRVQQRRSRTRAALTEPPLALPHDRAPIALCHGPSLPCTEPKGRADRAQSPPSALDRRTTTKLSTSSTMRQPSGGSATLNRSVTTDVGPGLPVPPARPARAS